MGQLTTEEGYTPGYLMLATLHCLVHHATSAGLRCRSLLCIMQLGQVTQIMHRP